MIAECWPLYLSLKACLQHAIFHCGLQGRQAGCRMVDGYLGQGKELGKFGTKKCQNWTIVLLKNWFETKLYKSSLNNQL